MTPSIRLDHVTLTLGARSFHYDLALEGAGIVGVTGPSGSGKSTLFHLIAGFEMPATGRMTMDGTDVAGLAPGQRPLTYIFQDHNLFAHLDIRTNIALGISPSLKLSALENREIDAALEKVGLAGFDKRRPADLSGGERQRVAFARALVRKRPFLLLDEPFASLDEQLRHSMGDLLVKLQRETGAMVLMITHDSAEIIRLATRVIEIRDGAIAYCGELSPWQERYRQSP